MDELDRAKIQRRQELDGNLEEAFKEGHTQILPADSLVRPSNWNLWYQMKSKEPQFSFDKPAGWDNVFDGYDKRLEYNNTVRDAVKANPEAAKQYDLNPWLMLMDSSDNKKRSP